MGILFVGSKNNSVVCDPVINYGSWADANFSIDSDMPLSMSGNVTRVAVESKRDSLLGQANGPISWCSKT